MKIVLKFITVLSFLTLISCASSGIKNIQAMSKDKKILVVSSMGDEFKILHIGFTIFSNKFKELNVEDWNIDEVIEYKISELPINKQFNIISKNLSSLKEGMDKLKDSFWTGSVSLKGFEEKIYPYAKNNNFDLILFINSYDSEDPIFFTGLQIDGYGLYKRKVFGKPSAKYYTITSSSLYDVNTKKKVAGVSNSSSIWASKYNTVKGVDSIDLEEISIDKDIIIDLVIQNISSQLRQMGILNSTE